MTTIAFETNPVYVTKAGVARYVRGLLSGFQQVGSKDFEIFPLAWEVENFGYRQPQRALKTAYRELIWPGIVARNRLRKINAELLHASFEPLIDPPDGIKEVVTIHDLALIRHPERFRRWHRYSSSRRLAKLPRADRLICISRFTADEVMSLLRIPATKIVVIHNGCDFQPGERPAESPPDFPVPPGFFLFVGSLEPGKNLSLLADTYRMAQAEKRWLPPLLIVGARWEGVGSEQPPPKDWHYLGRVSDTVLVHLYRRATALVFPSKYEGFGFPVVEAMALGCPVICSPVASLPEVGGDAVVMTDMNPEAYLRAMERFSRDGGWREDLVQRGYSQASKFSWKKCAEEVLEVYKSVLR